jgi:hypothetical protein
MQHGLPKKSSKLTEVLDPWNQRLEFDAVRAADKFQVVQSRKVSRESTHKGEGPRDAHAASYSTRGWLFGPTNQSDQCRFSSAITAENPDVSASFKGEADVIEDPVRSAACFIHFRHMFDG